MLASCGLRIWVGWLYGLTGDQEVTELRVTSLGCKSDIRGRLAGYQAEDLMAQLLLAQLA